MLLQKTADGKPAGTSPAEAKPAAAPAPAKSEHHAMGEDLVEVANYDGQWKPTGGGAPADGKKQ